MSVETLATVSPAREKAKQLVDELLHPNEQLQLFETDTDDERKTKVMVEELRRKNVGRLVLCVADVDAFRYRSAYAGTGLPPFEFDDITYSENDAMTEAYLTPFFNGLRVRVLPRFKTNHNRMWDEVNERPFAHRVLTTKYDLSTEHYITSHEDLEEIFMDDYENLKVCSDMGMDLL